MSDRLRVPLAKPAPDCQSFIKAVTTDYEPRRPPLVEYIVDRPVMEAVLGMIGRQWVQPGPDRASRRAFLDNFIAFWRSMGYDFVRLELSLGFPRPAREGGVGGRSFAETARGPVACWEDLEKYPWPSASDADLADYEYIAEHLPEGMGLIANHAGGVFEHLSFLMGYEMLCLSLYDQPELVQAVANRIGELMVEYYRRLLQLPRLIAAFPGDDMGFRSGTLIAPAPLRKFILPWHKRFARMTHQARLPYFLHSCGNIAEIMDDLIQDVGIDAKHSFEDAIIPAAEAKQRWGSRIGILGGVDLDKLTRLPPQPLRRYVRRIIESCAGGGRFAIGSGNSIPDYVPPINYLTMIDEALR